jgi:hypothetical protein
MLSFETVPRIKVAQLAATATNRRLVELEGITRASGPNRLILNDGTGEVRLIVCPQWYRPLSFQPSETVLVTGHLASAQTWRDNLRSFLVYRIQGDLGSRLTLRYDDGVPVWHRYRAEPGKRMFQQLSQEPGVASSRR